MAKVKQQLQVIVKALSIRSNSNQEPSPIETQAKDLPKKSTHWKTIFFIVSPLVLAACFVVGHYVLFKYLDGRLVDKGPLRQSLVTTMSLLLVTAVRICLVGCVGLCFAQHLWRVLRETALPIFRIEQLFCIRSNPLVLANPRVAWSTPLLFTMAIYIWFIELAAVYPPGALTVDSRPFLNTTQIDTAVINQPISNIAVPWEKNMTYAINYEGEVFGSTRGTRTVRAHYGSPLRSLTALSKFVLFTGRIVDIPPPAGQNMSYNMIFRAPQVSCAEQITNITAELPPETLDTFLNPDWDPRIGSPERANYTFEFPYPYQAPLFTSVWDGNDTLSLRQIRWLGGYRDRLVGPSNGSESTSEGERTVVYAGQQKDLICKASSMQYNLNITYHKGIQHVSYATFDPQPLFKYEDGIVLLLNVTGRERNQTQMEENLKKFEAWPETLKTALNSWNMFAQIDATLANMNYTWQVVTGPTFSKSVGNYTLENGTVVSLFRLDGSDKLGYNNSESHFPDPTLLQDSAFDDQRFNNSQPSTPQSTTQQGFQKGFFDPRDLNITERSINALLSNVTISMLSLGVQKDMVPVNITDFRNTYQFSDPLNFFLPYSLCLGIALLYVILGIWALVSNGVPATDGGFLQIMIATRGRTEMEKLVLKEGVVGTGDLPKELLDMKVRFGELVQDDGHGTGIRRAVTFGTVSETSPIIGPVRRRTTMRTMGP